MGDDNKPVDLNNAPKPSDLEIKPPAIVSTFINWLDKKVGPSKPPTPEEQKRSNDFVNKNTGGAVPAAAKKNVDKQNEILNGIENNTSSTQNLQGAMPEKPEGVAPSKARPPKIGM